MNIFQQIMSKILGSSKGDMSGPVPGAMGRLLDGMGIHEIGPHVRKGTPVSVLMGCKQELVLVPGATRPAFTREGKPVMAKDKHGRPYHVTDNYGVPKKLWKKMVNDQKRKDAGRWYSGEPADVRAKRLKKAA